MRLRESLVYRWVYNFLVVALLVLLFSGCENAPTFNDPVRDYLDYYTNSAAIEYHRLSCDYLVDKDGNVCISSDGDKSLIFYLRNPRKYPLDMSFSEIPSSSLSQDSDDRSVATFTYPSSFLLSHDGGQEIGGSISLTTADGVARSFDGYSFSLVCNSPPPSVKGPCVQTSGGKYIVCFYLPSSMLSVSPHNETHKIYINENLIEFEAVSSLPSSYTNVPSGGLNPLNGTTFSSIIPSGYNAFYYNTGRTVETGDDLSWNIYLEDDAGLCSKKMTASTLTVPVSGSVSGVDVLASGGATADTGTLTASIDEAGVSVASYSWTSSSSDIVNVTQDPTNPNQASVTSVGGGVATVSVQMELSDGRIVTKSKEVRVLSLSLDSGDLNLLKGQSATDLSVSRLGFPSTPVYTWNSSNPSAATVSGGSVSPVAKGVTTITVSASYGGKTVTSQPKTVNVHEATLGGTPYVFKDKTTSLSVTIESPSGVSAPSVSYSWQSNTASVATVPSGASGSSCTVTGVGAGTSVVEASVTMNGKTAVVSRTVSVYRLSLSGPVFIDKNGSPETFSASVSGYSGPVSYTWSSSAPGKATVGSGTNATNYVTPVATGATTISVSVTINGVTETQTKDIRVCGVSITSGTVSVLQGKSYTLGKNYFGFPSQPAYTWTSSNASVVTVDSSGAVTGVGSGTAVITLKASLGGLEVTTTKTVSCIALSFSNSNLNGNSVTIHKGQTYSGTINLNPPPTSGYGVNSSDTDIAGCAYDSEGGFSLVAHDIIGTVEMTITIWPGATTGDGSTTMKLFTVTVIE